MITRRQLLKAAGITVAGATAAEAGAVPAPTQGNSVQAPSPSTGPSAPPADPSSGTSRPAEAHAPLEALTAEEADLLTAIAHRLIPADANGPGAVEAGAIHYIDRALAGPVSSQRDAYRRGLAALERYARSSRGAPFRELAPVDQDSLLIDIETGGATWSGAGFDGSSAAFFALLKGHIWQGTFGDPYYGGNRDYVGWDLVGYPGVRTAVTAEDQRLGAVPARLRRSAYDSDQFHKA